MDNLRRALVIGLNSYAHSSQLKGCVADAEKMIQVLGRIQILERNYECRSLLDKMENGNQITRAGIVQGVP